MFLDGTSSKYSDQFNIIGTFRKQDGIGEINNIRIFDSVITPPTNNTFKKSFFNLYYWSRFKN